MQFILTKDEYEALAPVIELEKKAEALEVAREIIVKLSGVKCGHEYCDKCPLDYLRPTHHGITRDISHLICTKGRNYGK
jgi:transposase-like protein